MSLPSSPNTRKEMYLSNMAGQGTALPSEPHTREEEYLDYIAKNGGGGGTGEGDMTKAVYDDDLAVAAAGGIADYVAGAITGKVDKVQGKGLSTNDYDDSAKAIVDNVTTALDAKQPKTLSEPIYVDGVAKFSVETAIDAVNGLAASNKSALLTKADTSQIAAIQDGQNIDSFSDVETALDSKADLIRLAPQFHDDVAYTKGQYVTNNGALLRFKVDHSAGAFNPSEVYGVTVGEVLADKEYITSYDNGDFLVVEGEDSTTGYTTKSVSLNKSITPTQNDTKPITSGAVYNALGNKVDWASYAKTEAHNLIPYMANGNKVIGDTTFTVNDNGTITVNRSTGTNSNDLYFLGNSNSGNESGYKNWDIPNACRMTISCRGLQTGMAFFIVKWGTPSTSVIANITDASMKTSFDYDPNGKYRICLRTENGATFDNVTVEPLIKLESDPVDDISKSAMTNYQLSKRTDIVNIQPTVPNAVASIITLDPISGIIQQGNIVNFRIRFTLSVDKTGEFEIVNIGRPSALTYPMFVISDRNTPYAPVRGSYLSPVYEPANGIYYPIKTDGGTLTAGTYDVCGTFICKD